MELKDTWKDLENYIEGVPDSGEMASADDINNIAHAVINIENNKTTSISENPSNTKYPTEKAVADYVSEQGGGGSTINVIDNVDSTSQTDALSANMGRFINQSRLDFQNFATNELEKKEVRSNKVYDLTPFENYSDDYYASAKAIHDFVTQYVENKFGDIETALDKIIAIKNELIGGDDA